MSQDRNLKWLNNRRVIYRCNPVTDIPDVETDLYMFYKEGTYQCYTLFASKAKITTYKSLKWHFLVLYYLNDSLSPSSITYIFRFIADKNNGFVTFFISNKALEDMIQDVLKTGGDPPKNKLRKVIFKPAAWPLSLSEKLSIVGKLIGRSSKVDAESVYQCMLDLNDLGKKITWGKVAGLLNCSTRTIYRNLCGDLKREKQILNEEV
jgi:hypothetical protein